MGKEYAKVPEKRAIGPSFGLDHPGGSGQPFRPSLQRDPRLVDFLAQPVRLCSYPKSRILAQSGRNPVFQDEPHVSQTCSCPNFAPRAELDNFTYMSHYLTHNIQNTPHGGQKNGNNFLYGRTE